MMAVATLIRSDPNRRHRMWRNAVTSSFAVLLFMALAARGADGLQNQIADLSAPDVSTRIKACHSLGSVAAKDQERAVEALLGALNDKSDNVRAAAFSGLCGIGQGAAKAVPTIIALYRHGNCSARDAVGALQSIAPKSVELIDLLIELARGAKSGVVRPASEYLSSGNLRRMAIEELAKIGPEAKKSVPVLINVLNTSARSIGSHGWTFRVTASALSDIAVDDRHVLTTLKQFQHGKGFHSDGKHSSAIKDAILAADSAVRRLEQTQTSVDTKK
jgi:hypothetical protein